VNGDLPVENGLTLPRGPLREPPRALSRADLILARVGRTGMLPGNRTVLSRYTRAPIVTVTTALTGITDTVGNPVSLRSGLPVLGACGIARPEHFRRTLEEAGLMVREFMPFGDHAAFGATEVSRLVRRAANVEAVVVTAKDAVKLVPLWPDSVPLWVAHVELAVVDGGNDRGPGWVDQLLKTAERRFSTAR